MGIFGTLLSENYTPGQMIADNTLVWWGKAMNNCCQGLRFKKGWGYALVTSDDGHLHWVPGRHLKERKEEDMVRHRPSQRAASDGENSNCPKPVRRTNKAKLPTWGQLKILTIEGEKLVKEQGQPLTSATLFLAMLSVVTTTSGVSRGTGHGSNLDIYRQMNG